MNNELEALEGLFPCSHKVCEGICKECPHKKNYNLIKSALERKEKLEEEHKQDKRTIDKQKAIIHSLERYAKAWDICEKKKVCFDVFDMSYNWKEYIVLTRDRTDCKCLTETEFNLLKEMLEEK